jgi:hypothetical protein
LIFIVIVCKVNEEAHHLFTGGLNMAEDSVVSLTLSRVDIAHLKCRFQADSKGLATAIEDALRNGIFFCRQQQPSQDVLADLCDTRQGIEEVEFELSSFFRTVIFDRPELLSNDFSDLIPEARPQALLSLGLRS